MYLLSHLLHFFNKEHSCSYAEGKKKKQHTADGRLITQFNLTDNTGFKGAFVSQIWITICAT